MSDTLGSLSERLGYTFRDQSFLGQALTHRSLGSHNNERLEFLGDSILNFVIADELYKKFPNEDEGALSRMRASIVRGETLSIVAMSLGLGDHIRLGPGELKSGGHRRKSILADTVEAIIGAVYRDADFASSRELILLLFTEQLDAVVPGPGLKDPKSRLQEYLQGKQKPLPEYRVTNISGQQHSQVFTIECHVDGLDKVGAGTGSSRRQAEQAAADMAYQMLINNE
ncbi:MAG: ribonuclease III [Gammaproteobacteria bacterium]|nr:MAG: ribonuclease III [Gammaproteobacteria bacterium]